MASMPAPRIPSPLTGSGRGGPPAGTYRNRFTRAQSFSDFVAAARQYPELWRDMAARARVPEELVLRARELTAPRHLLVLLEDWCGDAINSVPYLDALASAVPQLDLRVLERDQHPDLMEAHLSPGGRRAIPVVIVLDEEYRERAWWGSRPLALQQWFLTPEAQALGSADRYREIRRWYARDRGRTTVAEVLELLERSVPNDLDAVAASAGRATHTDDVGPPGPVPRFPTAEASAPLVGEAFTQRPENSTMQNVQIISLDELRRQLASGAVIQFWNVLTDEYFRGELIPGSRRVPLDQIGREVARAGIAKDAAIVVYCAGPHCPQSGMAAAKLAALGFSNVRSYEGGVQEWKEAGLAVVRVGLQATAA